MAIEPPIRAARKPRSNICVEPRRNRRLLVLVLGVFGELSEE